MKKYLLFLSFTLISVALFAKPTTLTHANIRPDSHFTLNSHLSKKIDLQKKQVRSIQSTPYFFPLTIVTSCMTITFNNATCNELNSFMACLENIWNMANMMQMACDLMELSRMAS